jgi:hypothetical protein
MLGDRAVSLFTLCIVAIWIATNQMRVLRTPTGKELSTGPSGPFGAIIVCLWLVLPFVIVALGTCLLLLPRQMVRNMSCIDKFLWAFALLMSASVALHVLLSIASILVL